MISIMVRGYFEVLCGEGGSSLEKLDLWIGVGGDCLVPGLFDAQ